MYKNIMVMTNIAEICTELRNLFGENTTDSYLINEAIETFTASPEALMSDEITLADEISDKCDKKVNFRSSSYDRLCLLAQHLNISYEEVCRRILYHSLEESGYDCVQFACDETEDDILNEIFGVDNEDELEYMLECNDND